MGITYNIYCDESCHLPNDHQQAMVLGAGKEATFWHMISSGESESERIPDLHRCERIRWPYVIINASNLGLMKCWRNSRKEEDRIVIAVEDLAM